MFNQNREIMTRDQIQNLKVGDRIKVKTWNRDGRKTAIRKIVEINTMGVGIRLFGWNPFYVRDHEIVEKIED